MIKENFMPHDVVVIGTGPAGLTAAIYAARALLDTVVIDGLVPGGQLTITSDVENFPGFAEPIDGTKLMADMRVQAERAGAKIIQGQVTDVDLKNKPFIIIAEEKKIVANSVVVATGAFARWLTIDSETKLRGKGVSACATCDGFFFRGKEVAVVGGGDTAVEEALYLARLASKVTLIHRRDELRASKVLQERAKAEAKIKFAWNSTVEQILDVSKGVVTGVRIKNIQTGAINVIACDGVFIAIGHTPSTEIFKDKLKLDVDGYIVTDKTSMATSIAGVFAAGDCQDRTYRQAVTAAGTGCMAAISAERYLQQIK